MPSAKYKDGIQDQWDFLAVFFIKYTFSIISYLFRIRIIMHKDLSEIICNQTYTQSPNFGYTTQKDQFVNAN